MTVDIIECCAVPFTGCGDSDVNTKFIVYISDMTWTWTRTPLVRGPQCRANKTTTTNQQQCKHWLVVGVSLMI